MRAGKTGSASRNKTRTPQRLATAIFYIPCPQRPCPTGPQRGSPAAPLRKTATEGAGGKRVTRGAPPRTVARARAAATWRTMQNGPPRGAPPPTLCCYYLGRKHPASPAPHPLHFRSPAGQMTFAPVRALISVSLGYTTYDAVMRRPLPCAVPFLGWIGSNGGPWHAKGTGMRSR